MKGDDGRELSSRRMRWVAADAGVTSLSTVHRLLLDSVARVVELPQTATSSSASLR